MSYNIDSIDIVTSDGFCIPRPKLEALRIALGENAPDGCLFAADWPADSCEDIRGMLFVQRIDWSGEGSGYTFDNFKAALASFLGSADLVLTWEGGDSHTGLRLVNGKVTEHEVVMALGKERA